MKIHHHREKKLSKLKEARISDHKQSIEKSKEDLEDEFIDLIADVFIKDNLSKKELKDAELLKKYPNLDEIEIFEIEGVRPDIAERVKNAIAKKIGRQIFIENSIILQQQTLIRILESIRSVKNTSISFIETIIKMMPEINMNNENKEQIKENKLLIINSLDLIIREIFPDISLQFFKNGHIQDIHSHAHDNLKAKKEENLTNIIHQAKIISDISNGLIDYTRESLGIDKEKEVISPNKIKRSIEKSICI